jgi:hypothetical protein
VARLETRLVVRVEASGFGRAIARQGVGREFEVVIARRSRSKLDGRLPLHPVESIRRKQVRQRADAPEKTRCRFLGSPNDCPMRALDSTLQKEEAMAKPTVSVTFLGVHDLLPVFNRLPLLAPAPLAQV